MNFLFDIGHPAHVHLFRNYIDYLKGKGHRVFVVSRKKDVTEKLLDYYKIDHYPVTLAAKTKYGMLKELLERNKFIFNLHKKNKFSAAFGTSASIGFLKLKYGVPAFNFNEDDDDVIKIYSYLAYSFATKVINPDCLRFNKWRNKRVLHSSYHELAYLHPNNFIPDINIVKSYNLETKKYVIIRLSALQAHHDIGIKGISKELLEIIKENLFEYKIIESTEQNKKYHIKPWDMHHFLAYAKMIISNSQTITAEAAVLGIPSIRINDFVGRISYLEELENKYGLTYGFKPYQKNEIQDKINYILSLKELDYIWQNKRKLMLSDKIDLTDWMINYFEF